MPTENRSSNTEMVTFPRELCDELAELIAEKARVCGGGALEIWEAICKEFGKPAAQHQGEPVAWLSSPLHGSQKGKPFIVKGPDHFSENLTLYVKPFPVFAQPTVSGEPVAWLGTDMHGHSRFSYSKQTPDDKALYTQADPGEVERLSQIIRDLNDERDEIGAEAGRLRAQLAERDALLRDCFKAMLKGGYAKPLRERIKAALSASAEPGAPKGGNSEAQP